MAVPRLLALDPHPLPPSPKDWQQSSKQPFEKAPWSCLPLLACSHCCSELGKASHDFMPIVVEAVSRLGNKDLDVFLLTSL
jgi:hypothetical protein